MLTMRVGQLEGFVSTFRVLWRRNRGFFWCSKRRLWMCLGRFACGPSLTIDKLLSSNNVLIMGRPLRHMNLKAKGEEKNCF